MPFLILVALAAVLAGCGGGGSSSTNQTAGALAKHDRTAAVTTTASVARRANAICARSQKERNAKLETANGWVEGGNPDRRTKEKIVRFVLVAPVEELADELQSLATAEGNTAVSNYADQLAKDGKAIGAKPMTAYSGVAFEDSDHLAEIAGLSNCSL